MRQEKTCCKEKETRVTGTCQFTIKNEFTKTNTIIRAGNKDVYRDQPPENIVVTVGIPLHISLEGEIPSENSPIWFKTKYNSFASDRDSFTSEINRTYNAAKNSPEWKILLTSMGNRTEFSNDDNTNTTANVTVGDIEP